MKKRLTALLAIWGVAAVAVAQEATKPPKVNVETVYTGLAQPCGVAVQPGSGNIFVSESGAGQIVRFLPNQFDKPTTAVSGFPVDGADARPLHQVGPTGLAFLHQNLIVVGGGEQKDRADVIRVYELPASESPSAINFKDAKRTLTRLVAGQTKSSTAATFWGLALSPTALWVTSQNDTDDAGVLKASIGGNILEDLTPFVRTKDATQNEGPMGLAVRSSRDFLVISLAGKLDRAHDSVLAFFHMRTGGLLMTLPIPLDDVVALAYSPQGNRLYAVDMASASPNAGGLYRLDSAISDGRVAIKTVKLTSLDRPTALAFAPDNTLYVTASGTSEPADQAAGQKPPKRGVLLKVTGDL